MDTHSNNKRIAKNTFALYIRMGITMLVSLYTSRVVLNTLGVENYGIYNLVGGVVVLFSFISNALIGATQRFLTFELGKNDLVQFNKVFSVSLLSLTIISVILIILLETVGLWFLNNKLVIDGERLFAANIVFQLSVLSFIITINISPYTAAIISYERMSVYAFFGIFETVLKLLIVVLLPFLPYDKLITYGALVLAVTLITQTFNIVYCRRKINGTLFHFIFDKDLLLKLFSFSGWSLMGGASNILSNQGINIVFNLFNGVIVNAAFGISNQISNSVFQFVSNFQTAFSPQITKLYAKDEVENLYNLIYRASRLSFFLLFIVLVPIALSIDNILLIWLKTVPIYTNQFSLIILGVMLIDSISGPLWMLNSATGDIKKYQIFISSISLFNIILVYFLLIIGLSPAYALSSRLIVSIALLTTRLYILNEKVNFRVLAFLKKVIVPLVLVTGCVFVLAYPITLLNFINPWYSVLSKTLLSFVISFPVIYFLGLNKEEASLLKVFIISKISKKKNEM